VDGGDEAVTDFFFGAGATVVWFVMSALFLFCACWTWLIVLEIGGIRGTALGIVFLSAAITTSGFGLLLSHQAVVSGEMIGIVITSVWWPMVLAALVLTDLYAADRNGHRSFTARAYLWYERAVKGKNRGKSFGP
jgi:hypothetical protein